jgi:hypothetical protein
VHGIKNVKLALAIINELGLHPCGMKHKVREDRLNLRRPALRPERWVVVDGCTNFVFYRSQYRHMLR